MKNPIDHLVGGFNHLEKYESTGRIIPFLFWKIKVMFETTNLFFLSIPMAHCHVSLSIAVCFKETVPGITPSSTCFWGTAIYTGFIVYVYKDIYIYIPLSLSVHWYTVYRTLLILDKVFEDISEGYGRPQDASWGAGASATPTCPVAWTRAAKASGYPLVN